MLNKHRRTASQTSSIGGASIPGVLSIISAYIPAGSVDPSSGAAAGGPASYSSGASNSYARGGDDDETPPLSPSSQQGGTSVDGDQGRRDSGGRLRRWISSRR